MEDLLALAVLLIIVGAVVYVVAQAAGSRRRTGIQTAALESESARHYYQRALQMARVLDRIIGDEMIAVTIPQPLKTQIKDMVEDFYGEGGLPSRRDT